MAKDSRRNYVLLAMVVSMALSYMPWYNFSAVLGHITKEFGLSTADSGMIMAAFQAGYVVVVPLTGWLSDRFGAKHTVFWATMATAVFSTLFAWLAAGKWSILALRLATGLSAGAIYVPGMTLLSKWFPASKRGMALGAYTAALVTAYAGGYFIAAPTAAAHGWRMGILLTSLPGFLGAALVYAAVQEARVDNRAGRVAGLSAGAAAPADWAAEKRLAAVDQAARMPTAQAEQTAGLAGPILITLAYVGHMWEQYAFWGWLGPYLSSAAAASSANAGMSAALATAWGGRAAAFIILLGAPATLLWGMVADRKGRTWAILVASSCSLAAELVVGYLYRYSLGLTVVVASWIGFWVVADSAIYKAGLTEMVGPKVRATYLGVQSAIGFAATIVAPIVFGFVLQRFNGSVSPLAVLTWGPAFLVLGAGTLLAPLSSLLLRLSPQARMMGAGRM